MVSLEGFDVVQVGDLKLAAKKLETTEFDLVLCNLKRYDGNSVAFGKKIKTNYLLIETILLTSYGTIPDDVQAIKNGAFDYITKGDDNSKILPLLYKVCKKVA